MTKRSHKTQAGAAALEFAICLPSLLMLMAGTLYFGLALLARLELTQLATEAVRACVLQQSGSVGVGSYTACAEAQFNNILAASGESPCDSGQPQVSVSASTNLDGSLPPLAMSQVNLLELQISCTKTISPLVNGTASGSGPVPGTITVVGRAGMPFVLATRAR